jgi:uncharacterized protein
MKNLFDMPSKGALSGRLGRIRKSRDRKNFPGDPVKSPELLNPPWKLDKAFVSIKQEIFRSPFKSKFNNKNIPVLFPEMENRNVKDLLFYDLETTGLSGGAGTIAFLAGFGWIEKDNLIINQYFLHDFPGEIDLLNSIKQLMSTDKILVSYNGKSFDHPLLRTRFLMKRMKIPELPEIDLLHISRRIWKNRLSSCRLGEIENSILNVHRVNDIPGIEIPDIYFNFLKTKNTEPLEGVFKHHQQDIKSLAYLFAYLEELWTDPSGIPENDKFSFGKLLLIKNRDVGIRLLKESWRDKDYDAAKVLSIYFKRKGDLFEASDIWKKMWYGKQELFQGLELAKYYEHKIKDIKSALNIVKVLQGKGNIRDNIRIMKDLEHRCNRLERKLNIISN